MVAANLHWDPHEPGVVGLVVVVVVVVVVVGLVVVGGVVVVSCDVVDGTLYPGVVIGGASL